MTRVRVISGLSILAVLTLCFLGSGDIWDYTISRNQEKSEVFSVDHSSNGTKGFATRYEGDERGKTEIAPSRLPSTENLPEPTEASTELEVSGTPSASENTATEVPRGGANKDFVLSSDHLEELVTNTAAAVSKMRFISDEIFPANFSLQFLPEYKTPCWRENASLWCLPYFFIPGFPKCGTTELFRKVVAHPEICMGRAKEPHWWTRQRYKKNINFGFYKTFFKDSVSRIDETVDDSGFHPLVLTEGSASTVWDNSKLFSLDSYEDPTYLNIHVIHSVLPQAKFVVIMRNPVSRLYSDYLYFQKGYSPEDFHKQVNQSVSLFRDCLQDPARSFLHCVYAGVPRTESKDMYRRLRIGLYCVHLRLLLCVYPRSNVFILQLEDYMQDEVRWLRDIMNFLDVSDMPAEDIEAVIQQSQAANTNKNGYKKAGAMLNETQTMLEEFYQPFNVLLAELLGDKYIKY